MDTPAMASVTTSSRFLLESSDDDSDLDDELNAPPTFSQQSQASPSNSQKEASPTVTPNQNDEDAIEERAQRKAKFLSLSIANDISSSSELYWHRRNKKTAPPFPVRICPESEKCMVPQVQGKTWDPSKQVLVQFLGQYEDRNQHAVVLLSQLTPYHNGGDTSMWCPNNTKEFIKSIKTRQKGGKDKFSPVQLRLEELYLEKLLERVVDKEQAAEQQQSAGKKDSNNDNSDDDKEVEEDMERTNEESNNAAANPKPPSRSVKSLNGQVDEGKKHKLRAGDVIEYTSPQFVAGREEGYRCTTILSIKKQPYPLILENAELLPRDHLIRRISRKVRNKLVEYNGKIRPISHHALQYDTLNVHAADGLAKEAKRVGDIVDKNMAKHRAGLEASGIPLDILQNVGKQTRGIKNEAQETKEEVDIGGDANVQAGNGAEANHDGDDGGERVSNEPTTTSTNVEDMTLPEAAASNKSGSKENDNDKVEVAGSGDSNVLSRNEAGGEDTSDVPANENAEDATLSNTTGSNNSIQKENVKETNDETMEAAVGSVANARLPNDGAGSASSEPTNTYTQQDAASSITSGSKKRAMNDENSLVDDLSRRVKARTR